MFAVMFRHMWRAKGQTAATMLLATLIVLLVAIPSAIRDSAVDKPQNYLRNAGADVFAMQAGVHDYFSNSIISTEDIEAIKAIGDVADAQGVHLLFTAITAGNELERGVVQSYHPKKGFGGPWEMSAGRQPSGTGEVAIDKGFEKTLSIGLGDKVEISGREYRVVGFTDETAAIAKQLIFMTAYDVENYVIGSPGLFNFILVRTDNPTAVRNEIRQLGLSAYTRSEFVEENYDYWESQIAPSLNMVIYVTVICGIIMVLLATLQTVRSRKRLFGIQKAFGVSTLKLSTMELGKLLIASLVGIAIGVAIGFFMTDVVNAGTAGLEADLTPQIITTAVVIMAAVSILSVIPSIISLRRIDAGIAIKEAV